MGTSEPPRVTVVDDDESVREALKSLLRPVGLGAEGFASAEEFLSSEHPGETACLILDLQMPGMSGLELQRRLASVNSRIPIIFITAHASDEEARALRDGAVDFLCKPFSEEALLDDIYKVLGPGGDGASGNR